MAEKETAVNKERRTFKLPADYDRVEPAQESANEELVERSKATKKKATRANRSKKKGAADAQPSMSRAAKVETKEKLEEPLKVEVNAQAEEKQSSVEKVQEPTPIETASSPNRDVELDISSAAPADIFIANIPDWLTHEPFVLWRLSTNPDGRQTKLPLTVAKERLITADVTNPDHFLDFVDACDAFNRFSDQVNGLGLVLHGDNITAVDLDHCLDEHAAPSPFAADMLKRLEGAYVEISQSGSGLHFFFVDEFNDGLARNRNKHIEIYIDKRFIALTGDKFRADTAEHYILNGETLRLAADVFVSADAIEYNVGALVGITPELDTDSLLSLIRRSKGADMFNRLFNGDVAVKDDDWSRADFALCYKLAWWTNGNFDQIKEIWQRSKLAGRNKFSRTDYVERTVVAVIELWKKNGSQHYERKSKSSAKEAVCVAPELNTVAEDIDLSFDVETLRRRLAVNRFGMPLARAINFDVIFDSDPNVKGLVAFNAFSQRIELMRRPFWRNDLALTKAWQDSDDAALQNYLDRTYALTGESACRRTLDELAHKNAFHPVRDYFKELPPWDGKKRAEKLLVDNLGAPDTEYVRAVTKHWLLAAVSRIFHPGCKFDYCLVLKGKQGIGKSTLLSRLGGEWFGELNSIQGKDAVGDLQGLWIVELVEMQATKRADNEQIKAFLSTNCDRARLSYDRRTSEFPRQCVFAATTNEHEFLRDQTGGRRFWIVELDATEYGLKSDLEIELVWAEILNIYNEKFGEGFNAAELDIPNDVKSVATELQAKNTDGADLRGRIAAFLDRPIPIDSFWQLLSQEERRQYFRRGAVSLPLVRIRQDEWTEETSETLRRFAKKDIDDKDCVYITFDTENDDLRYLLFNRNPRRRFVSPVELANELFYDDKLAVSNRRIADIMRTLEGWQPSKRRRRDSAYGIQNTVFERIDELE